MMFLMFLSSFDAALYRMRHDFGRDVDTDLANTVYAHQRRFDTAANFSLPTARRIAQFYGQRHISTVDFDVLDALCGNIILAELRINHLNQCLLNRICVNTHVSPYARGKV